MVKSIVKMSVALAAVIFLGAALALAMKGKTVKVYYDSVLPNGQTLKAGDYTVQVNETAHKVEFLQKGKVVAETTCNCVDNGKKNAKTLCIFDKNKQGKEVLQEVHLAGEKTKIILQGE